MTPFVVLADGPTGEAAKSGPWGLAIILLLCAGCYFLFKSMSKHLRRVREDFPADETGPTLPAASATADATADATVDATAGATVDATADATVDATDVAPATTDEPPPA